MKKWCWILIALLLLCCSAAFAENVDGIDIAGGVNISVATPIDVNTYYTDHMASYTDENYYKFTLTEPGTVSISFTHDYADVSGGCWEIKILNLSLNSYLEDQYSGNKTAIYKTYNTGLPAGTYYVMVHPYTIYWSKVNYSFRINFSADPYRETEFNNTPPKADPIELDTYYTGALWYVVDDDYYTFTMPADGYVSVSLSHDYSNDSPSGFHMRIIDDAQKRYLTEDYSGKVTAETTTDRVFLRAGKYYVYMHFENFVWFFGDYRFKVNYIQDLSDCTVDSIPNQIYTGSQITPSVTVRLNGNVLTKDVDYTAIYEDNQYVGKAVVRIEGIGKYMGEKYAFFIINPAKVKLSSLKAGKKELTVRWKAGACIDGYEIQYSLKKNFSGAKTVRIKSPSQTKTVLKKLKAKKTYYVRIRSYATVDGKKYLSEWSNVLKKKTKK